VTVRSSLSGRAFLLLFGSVAVFWGASVFPLFWFQSPIEGIAARIIDGHPFRVDALIGQVRKLDAIEQAARCRPAAVRSAAIIRLRILEEAFAAGERESIDSKMSSMRDSILRSLACSPADPFLWFVLHWAENTRLGFNSDNLKYLRLSYRWGPNEGWIAVKRNRFALSVFEALPEDLEQAVVKEFARLVTTGLHEEVIAILTSVGWPVREPLLAALKEVPERQRRALAERLYARGYDIEIPDVKIRGR
jgi:hypothetical protein